MTSRWFGTLLIAATALTPIAAQAQDSFGEEVRAQARAAAVAATSGGIHTVDVPASNLRSTPAVPPSAGADFQRGERGNRGGGGWGGRGGGHGGGGWGTPSASPSPSPAPAPSAPSNGGWRSRSDNGGGGWRPRPENGGGGNGGGWRTRVDNDGGGWRQPRAENPAPAPVERGNWGNRRGDGNRWQPPVSSPTPTPVESGRWQGRNGGYRQGDASTGGGWRSNDGNRTDAARGGYRQGDARYTSRAGNRDGGFGNRVIRDAERANGGNRYDGQRSDGNRWDRRDGNRYDNDRRWDRRDHDRYDGRHDYGRYSNRGYNNWDRNWRNDRRYDWQSHRTRYSSYYRMPHYYSPYRDWSYRRLYVGFNLWPLFYSERFWITNPWYYRLPDVYGPYRWVRYYDDALLVDIETGEVVDVIDNFFW